MQYILCHKIIITRHDFLYINMSWAYHLVFLEGITCKRILQKIDFQPLMPAKSFSKLFSDVCHKSAIPGPFYAKFNMSMMFWQL